MKPLIGFFAELVRTYQTRRVSRSAAEFAYFLTLSIFPLLIAVVAILSSFEMSLEGMLGDDLWAQDVTRAVLEYIGHVGQIPSTQIIFVSLTVLFTSCAASFRAVANSMQDIEGRPRYQGFWGLVVSFMFSLLLLFTIYFSVFMIVTGTWLMETVEYATGIYGLAAAWQRLRFVALFALAVVAVHLIYTFTAPKKPKIRRLPGAIFATVALVIGSVIFSTFMAVSARYPLLYGSLASFILLMVWAYLCGNLLIIGNLFNYQLYQWKKRERGRAT
ncbi:MAG: YihY/virulence factor BrkB family protein [Oscillospiraceae bacterium]|nr:YihY/virulence factor BrkB family protein [Oscillospiraceae bacterium]